MAVAVDAGGPIGGNDAAAAPTTPFGDLGVGGDQDDGDDVSGEGVSREAAVASAAAASRNLVQQVEDWYDCCGGDGAAGVVPQSLVDPAAVSLGGRSGSGKGVAGDSGAPRRTSLSGAGSGRGTRGDGALEGSLRSRDDGTSRRRTVVSADPADPAGRSGSFGATAPTTAAIGISAPPVTPAATREQAGSRVRGGSGAALVSAAVAGSAAHSSPGGEEGSHPDETPASVPGKTPAEAPAVGTPQVVQAGGHSPRAQLITSKSSEDDESGALERETTADIATDVAEEEDDAQCLRSLVALGDSTVLIHLVKRYHRLLRQQGLAAEAERIAESLRLQAMPGGAADAAADSGAEAEELREALLQEGIRRYFTLLNSIIPRLPSQVVTYGGLSFTYDRGRQSVLSRCLRMFEAALLQEDEEADGGGIDSSDTDDDDIDQGLDFSGTGNTSSSDRGVVVSPSTRSVRREAAGDNLDVENSGENMSGGVRDACGYIMPGTMTLIIGPVGSGKSTLMRLLSGRTRPNRGGEVRYNGTKVLHCIPQRLAGVAHQKDFHLPSLSILETLEFARAFSTKLSFATLPLDDRLRAHIATLLPDGEHDPLVFSRMAMLGLTRIAQQRVGSPAVTEEERHRLSAAELLTGPYPVLFIDGISKSVDGPASQRVLSTLKAYAQVRQAAVVCALEWPTAAVYTLFDRVTVLCHGGHVAYDGPREEALLHFARLGYEKPQHMSVPEFLQQVGALSAGQPTPFMSLAYHKADSHYLTPAKFAHAYRRSQQHRDVLRLLARSRLPHTPPRHALWIKGPAHAVLRYLAFDLHPCDHHSGWNAASTSYPVSCQGTTPTFNGGTSENSLAIETNRMQSADSSASAAAVGSAEQASEGRLGCGGLEVANNSAATARAVCSEEDRNRSGSRGLGCNRVVVSIVRLCSSSVRSGNATPEAISHSLHKDNPVRVSMDDADDGGEDDDVGDDVGNLPGMDGVEQTARVMKGDEVAAVAVGRDSELRFSVHAGGDLHAAAMIELFGSLRQSKTFVRLQLERDLVELKSGTSSPENLGGKAETKAEAMAAPSDDMFVKQLHQRHLLTWTGEVVLLLRRQMMVITRDQVALTARLLQVSLLGLFNGFLCFQMPSTPPTVANLNLRRAISLLSLVAVTLNNIGQLPGFLQDKAVAVKHHKKRFFRASAFITAHAVAGVPFSLIEATVWTLLAYPISGLTFTDYGAHFWIYLGIMMLTAVHGAALVRAIAFMAATPARAGFLASLLVGPFLFLFASFVISLPLIPAYWTWAYWADPMQWAGSILMASELGSPAFGTPCAEAEQGPNWPVFCLSYPDSSVGDAYLMAFGWNTNKYVFFVGPAVMLAWIVVWNVVATMCLAGAWSRLPVLWHRLMKGVAKRLWGGDGGSVQGGGKGAGPDRQVDGSVKKESTAPSLMASEDPEAADQRTTLLGTAVGSIPETGQTGTDGAGTIPMDARLLEGGDTAWHSSRNHLPGNTTSHHPSQPPGFRSCVPFPKFLITWHSLSYEILRPTSAAAGAVADNSTAAGVEVLSGVSGWVYPGEVFAIVGGRCTGKSSLVNCLSGRNLKGRLKGQVLVNGAPRDLSAFVRATSYVQRAEHYYPYLTVAESMQYRAAVLLPRSTSRQLRSQFVDEILTLFQLHAIAQELVIDLVAPQAPTAVGSTSSPNTSSTSSGALATGQSRSWSEYFHALVLRIRGKTAAPAAEAAAGMQTKNETGGGAHAQQQQREGEGARRWRTSSGGASEGRVSEGTTHSHTHTHPHMLNAQRRYVAGMVEVERRVVVAMEVMGGPSVVFLDEPFAGMDLHQMAAFAQCLKHMASVCGRVVVLATGVPSAHVLHLVDRVAMLKKRGELVYFGPAGPFGSSIMEYFHTIPGIPLPPPNANPIEFLIGLVGDAVGSAGADGGRVAATGPLRDFAFEYRVSALALRNARHLAALRLHLTNVGEQQRRLRRRSSESLHAGAQDSSHGGMRESSHGRGSHGPMQRRTPRQSKDFITVRVDRAASSVPAHAVAVDGVVPDAVDKSSGPAQPFLQGKQEQQQQLPQQHRQNQQSRPSATESAAEAVAMWQDVIGAPLDAIVTDKQQAQKQLKQQQQQQQQSYWYKLLCVNWMVQLFYLRNRTYTLNRYLHSLIIALVIGSLYYHLPSDSLAAIGASVSLIFIMTVFGATGNGATSVSLLSQMRHVFERERVSKQYVASAYVVAFTVAEILYLALTTLTFVGIVVGMSQLATLSAGQFFAFWFSFFLAALSVSYIGLLLAVAMPTLQLASLAVPIITSVCLGTAGLVVPYPKMIFFFRPLFWINPLQYAIHGMMATAYYCDTQASACAPPPGCDTAQQNPGSAANASDPCAAAVASPMDCVCPRLRDYGGVFVWHFVSIGWELGRVPLWFDWLFLIMFCAACRLATFASLQLLPHNKPR